MACTVANVTYSIRSGVYTTLDNVRETVVVICSTMMDAEGAAKITKFAIQVIEFAHKEAPELMSIAFKNSIKELKILSTWSETADVFKRWKPWFSGEYLRDRGRPGAYIEFVALISVTALRMIGLVVHAAKLGFFEMKIIFDFLGNIPVIGWVTHTLPLNALGMGGVICDTISNMYALKNQETIGINGIPLSDIIKMRQFIRDMWLTQEQVCLRDQYNVADGMRYSIHYTQEFDDNRLKLTRMIATSNGTAPRHATVSLAEQAAFNHIYLEQRTPGNGIVTYMPANAVIAGAVALVGLAAPGVAVIPHRYSSIDLLALKTAGQWHAIFNPAVAAATPVAGVPAGDIREAVRYESRRWEVLTSKDQMVKGKPIAAIQANVIKMGMITLVEAAGWLKVPAAIALMGSSPFMLHFGMIVATSALVKVMYGKRENPSPTTNVNLAATFRALHV